MALIVYIGPVCLFLLVHISISFGQSVFSNSISPNLVSCYNNSELPGITIADRRPPATLNIFIEYLRKLEDANPTLSTRELSVKILRSLRQDGIIGTDKIVDEHLAVPFASTRLERDNFRLIMRVMLPDIELDLDFGSLNQVEKCSLHYMISSTINDLKRDNEARDCLQSSQYTSRIGYRRRRNAAEKEDTEFVNTNINMFAASNANASACPIELGVIDTLSGTIKVGNVLAGIATALNQQTVSSVDNRYAGTILGQVSEAVLYQRTDVIKLGSQGNWNSTINPKYFFLQNNNNLQATDAEIRGGLDGLYMALKMDSWRQKYSDIKISQIIDMYYSPYEKGVFDKSLKACNRNILYSELTNSPTMKVQLVNLMPFVTKYSESGFTFSSASFNHLSEIGLNALESYLPSMASNDLPCTGGEVIERVATDLLIFVDSGWEYSTVQSVISYILNNIDVSKFGSKYTIYGGATITNLTSIGTNSLSEYFLGFNRTVYANETNGFDYVKIFERVESYATNKLNNNTVTTSDSTIVLLIPKSGGSETEKSYVKQRREIISKNLPDLNIMVLGGDTANDYNDIVSNPNKEVIILQDTTTEETLKTIGNQVVSKIKSVPRAVVNPFCTSNFNGPTRTFTLTEYVEPEAANYYRISPNYFYSGSSTRNLKIREQGYGTVTVCISRDNSKPDNTTGTCKALSQTEYTIEITTYCEGNSVNSCSPIYLGVFGGTSSINCKEVRCRFPGDIKYTITLDNVDCARGKSIVHTASATIMFLMSAFLWFRNFSY